MMKCVHKKRINDEQTLMGAQVNIAVNLLNNFIREIDDNDLYMKVIQLKTLAERGVITYSQTFTTYKGFYAEQMKKLE